jgi:EpsI family protein
MIKVAVAIAFLALNAYTYYWMAHTAVIPPRETFASFPLELGEWSCNGFQSLDRKVLKNLGATDYLICDYRRPGPGESVSVYVGYHQTQIREQGGGAGENSIHPPAHCLPGAGWDIIDTATVELDLPGLPPGAKARRLIVAKGAMRQLVYYWYQSRGRVISEDWQKIVWVGWDRAVRGRTDGSLVRFTVPIQKRGGEEGAERAFRDLAPQVVGRLARYVPQ